MLSLQPRPAPLDLQQLSRIGLSVYHETDSRSWLAMTAIIPCCRFDFVVSRSVNLGYESPFENPMHRDPPSVTDISAAADFSRGNDGLLPAIAQDAENGRVLMMAWMNEEAFRETLASGQAVYFSRSRKSLWRKGESSGHRQTVVEVRVDCDRDTILLRVKQVGAACHEGFESCFYRRVDTEDASLKIVDDRLVDPATVYGR